MGLTTDETAAIEAALAAPDVVAAFTVLMRHRDLAHAELPKLSRAQFAALRAEPRQARGFALGFSSPNGSVRRFCKKFVKHAGPDAADALFLLLLETADALRPGPGPFGEFTGVASPVGGYVLKTGLSTAEPQPPHVYSPAARYGRAVVEPALKALASAAPERLLQLQEYSEALVRSPVDRESHAPRPWADELDLNGEISQGLSAALHGLARKGDPALLAALQRWSQRELTLAGSGDDDAALSWARQRFAELGDEDHAVARRRLRWEAASLLPALPREARGPLYEALVARSTADPGTPLEEGWVAHRLDEYRKRHPGDREFGEIDRLKAQATVRDMEARLSALDEPQQPPPARGSIHDAYRAEIAAAVQQNHQTPFMRQQFEQALAAARAELAQLDGDAGGEPVAAGPPASEVASAVETLARLGGCPDAWHEAIVAMGLGDFTLKDEAPAPSNAAAAVAAKPAFAQLLALCAGKDEEPVPEAALAEVAQPLLALTLELCAALAPRLPELTPNDDPYRDPSDPESELTALLSSAMTLLPEDALEELASWCVAHAQPGHVFRYDNVWDPAAELLLKRGQLAPTLFGFVLPRQDSARSTLGDQRVLWRLYSHPDPRGRALVLETVRGMRLPRKGDYLNGPPWRQPWQAMLTQAWAADDLELFVACFERCAVQTYAKGRQVFVPEVRVPITEGYRANSVPTDAGVALEEVWSAVRERYSEQAAPILAALFACADADELPGQVLRLAAKDEALEATGYRFPADALLGLLGSSTVGVVNLGLELLQARPHHGQGSGERLLAACAEHLRGESSGSAKAAARVIGTLAQTFPALRGAAAAQLSDGLEKQFDPAALQAIKSLTALAKQGALSSPALGKRLKALKRKDAKRFGKPADALLALL